MNADCVPVSFVSALEREEAAHVGHARGGVQPVRHGPVVATLEGGRVRLASLRLDKRGVEQCGADVAPARRLGDDQVRDPRLRLEREERLTELEADESHRRPLEDREHRAGVGARDVLVVRTAQRRELLLTRGGPAKLGEQARGRIEVGVGAGDRSDLDTGVRCDVACPDRSDLEVLALVDEAGGFVELPRSRPIVGDLQLDLVPATQPPLGDRGVEEETADAPPRGNARGRKRR